MNNFNIVRGGYYSPHVYFILARDVIYIGETQFIPIKRWSAHLGLGGSFNKKLDKHLDGASNSNYMSSIIFCSYACVAELSLVQEYYCGYKVPTQALEHKLHEIVSSKKTFGKDKCILSETVKTAPRKFYHWNEITEIANKIINETIKKLAL